MLRRAFVAFIADFSLNVTFDMANTMNNIQISSYRLYIFFGFGWGTTCAMHDPHLEYVAIVLTSIKHALDWPP